MLDDASRTAAALLEASAAKWTRLVRAGYDVYRDAQNTPAFLEMLPSVAGLRGLDIGCGEGTNTRHVARLGARMNAIDVAPTFVAAAREAERDEPLGIDYQLADAVALPFPDASFDFATAFMSLMDVPDFPRALREASRVLRDGGFLQFSILHPCFATPHRKVLREPDGQVRAIEIGEYFGRPEGLERWLFSAAPADVRASTPPFEFLRLHATLGEWLNAVVAAELRIEQLGEPTASVAEARAVPMVADTRVAPLFLHVRARR